MKRYQFLLLLEVEPDAPEVEGDPIPTAETMGIAVAAALAHSTAREALEEALVGTVSLRMLDDRALDDMAHDIVATEVEPLRGRISE